MTTQIFDLEFQGYDVSITQDNNRRPDRCCCPRFQISVAVYKALVASV